MKELDTHHTHLPNIDPNNPKDCKLVRKALQNVWVNDIESGRYQAIQKVLSDAALKHPFGNGSREHLKAIALHLKYTQMNIDPQEDEITPTMFFNFVNQQNVDMSVLDEDVEEND